MIRKRGGSYGVKVWNPATGRDEWAGSRGSLKAARQLERDTERRYARSPVTGEITVTEYVERWLTVKHGPGTRRPQVTTGQQNRMRIKAFVDDFGAQRLGSVRRRDALDWAAVHPSNAKAVSALYNDAIDDEYVQVNPFANRRQKQSRGRRDIVPLTMTEVDRLATIATGVWGLYGPTCRAWVLCAAWIGWRPGEAFAARWDDLDLDAGTVRIERQVQADGERLPKNDRVRTVILPGPAKVALLEMSTVRSGLLFRTMTGRQISKRAYTWYWERVRTPFALELDVERRAELLAGRPNLDLYELRHFCASMLRARGASYDDIAFQLGNSAKMCEDTYCHLYAGETERRLSALFEDAESARRQALVA